MNLTEFLKYYRIVFLIPGIKLNSLTFAEFIKSKLPRSSIYFDLPEENQSEIIIVIPTKESTFGDLHHTSFLERNYKVMPKSIIFICGFDRLLSMFNFKEWLGILTHYKIPVLHSRIANLGFDSSTELLSIELYKHAYEYYHGATIITEPRKFIDVVRSTILDKSKNSVKFMCFYQNNEQKEAFIKAIEHYDDLLLFYMQINSSSSAALDLDDNGNLDVV